MGEYDYHETLRVIAEETEKVDMYLRSLQPRYPKERPLFREFIRERRLARRVLTSLMRTERVVTNIIKQQELP